MIKVNRRESVLIMKNYFPNFTAESLEKLSDFEAIHEIRLRTGRPVGIVSFGSERFLTEKGGLTSYPDMCRKLSSDDMEYSFRAVCDYSIHSYKREISEGFVTLEGGNRVGICGTAVVDNGHVSTLKYISGLNFRIAGQAIGCADKLCREIISNGIESTLIIGPPMSGKTTFIRDMCRILGESRHVSVIDERGEIAAVYHGIAQNNIGKMTDVFDGYPKAEGIMTAVRVMSPEIVVCDEIGGKEDCAALMSSANTGVKIIASAHGNDIKSIKERKYLKEIIECGIFRYCVTLKGGNNIGKQITCERIN